MDHRTPTSTTERGWWDEHTEAPTRRNGGRIAFVLADPDHITVVVAAATLRRSIRSAWATNRRSGRREFALAREFWEERRCDAGRVLVRCYASM